MGLLPLAACSANYSKVVPDVTQLASNQWSHDQVELSPAKLQLPEEATLLIEQALGQNFTLVSAKARMEAAHRAAVISQGARWPSLSAELSDLQSGTDNRISGLETSSRVSSAVLALNVDVDLWGRLAATANRAELASLQQALQFRITRDQLGAAVVSTWLSVIETQAQQFLAQQRVDNLRENVAVIQDGFNAGVRDAFDVYAARAELMVNITALKQRQLAHSQLLRELAVLLGQPVVDAGLIPRQFPQIPAPIPSELQASLLQQRPDMIAAELMLQQQHLAHRIAKLNRLPRLTLTANTGFSDDRLSALAHGDMSTWRILGGLTAPLFQGRQLQAEQQRQKILLNAEIANYQQTALSAFADIEQALINERFYTEQERSELEAVRMSRLAEQQALELYISGLSNVNTLLQAQRNAFDRQSRLLSIQTLVLSNRIHLYLALGGQFLGTLGHDEK